MFTVERPGPVQKRTQDLQSNTCPMSAGRRAAPWLSSAPPSLFPGRGIYGEFGSQRWHWPCPLSVASSHLLLPSHCMTRGSQTPPLPICVWSPRSTRDSAASLPPRACGRGRCISLTFPPPTIQTALVRKKIKEKKETKPPTPVGKNV